MAEERKGEKGRHPEPHPLVAIRPDIPRRFARLPVERIFDIDFPVAVSPLARLSGLAFLDLDEAGSGLVIPKCRSVHTCGMRFPIDLVFLDGRDAPVSIHRRVGPGRVIRDRRAVTVLESVGALDMEWSDGDRILRGERSWLP